MEHNYGTVTKTFAKNFGFSLTAICYSHVLSPPLKTKKRKKRKEKKRRGSDKKVDLSILFLEMLIVSAWYYQEKNIILYLKKNIVLSIILYLGIVVRALV